MSDITWYLFFSDWLISLSIMLSIQCCCKGLHFSFLWPCSIPLYKCTIANRTNKQNRGRLIDREQADSSQGGLGGYRDWAKEKKRERKNSWTRKSVWWLQGRGGVDGGRRGYGGDKWWWKTRLKIVWNLEKSLANIIKKGVMNIHVFLCFLIPSLSRKENEIFLSLSFVPLIK